MALHQNVASIDFDPIFAEALGEIMCQYNQPCGVTTVWVMGLVIFDT
jgi:hypothetical protein